MLPGTRSPWAAIAAGVATAVLTIDLALRTPPQDGLMFVLALPVAIVALQHGRRPAILAVAAAAAFVVGTSTLQGEQMSALGYATRVLMFGLAGWTGVWMRRAPAGDRPAPRVPSPNGLTARELEVLRLIACGHTNKEAALALSISVRTIESHRARIQEKLACGGRADLFRRAQELGLITA